MAKFIELIRKLFEKCDICGKNHHSVANINGRLVGGKCFYEYIEIERNIERERHDEKMKWLEKVEGLK